MSTLNHEALADLRARLQDYMLVYARMDAGRTVSLDVANWALAARLELLRRFPLVGALDDELLAAIASLAVEPGVEACYLVRRLRDVEAEASGERMAAMTDGVPLTARQPDLLPAKLEQMEVTITLIAEDTLGFKTLEVRQRDRFGVRECSVVGVRAALMEAYEEGWHAAA